VRVAKPFRAESVEKASFLAGEALDAVHKALTQITAITRARTITELETAFLEAVEGLGVRTYAASYIDTTSHVGPEKNLISNWPDEWREIWLKRQLFFDDPVTWKALTTPGGFYWRDASAYTNVRGEAGFAQAREFGMSDGYALSRSGPKSPFALVSVAGEKIEWTPAEEGVANFVMETFLSRLLFLRDAGFDMLFRKLSPQEQRCLALAAQGMSDKEAARALSISHHTVTAHMKSVQAKLQAPNRAAAVAAGIWTGQIEAMRQGA
jgi:DNA-binding CsgD family transcriptional regulator